MKKFICLSFLLLFYMFAWSEEDCTSYRMVAYIWHIDEVLRYTLTTKTSYDELSSDSCWIQRTINDSTIVYYASHAQPGDYIDISFLSKGTYKLRVKIGDCVLQDTFGIRRGATTQIDEAAQSMDENEKLFRAGQLLIRRGDKTYDAQGREIK